MKFKKLAALTLAGAMSLSLAACGGGGGDTASPAPNTGSPSAATDTPAPEGEVYKIGVLAPEVTHGWSAGVAYYAEKRCDELVAEGKIEKKILISGDAAEMTTQLDELKTWGADAIVAFPQWEGMEVPIQQAIDEGITVVNFDIAIEADGVYRVSGDNYDMGYQSAQYIVDKIGTEGTVVILDVPTSGTYHLGGVDVSTMDDDQQAEIRNKMLGFIFQQYNLIPKLNVLENVELPLLYAGVSAAERHERAIRSLERVGLADKCKNLPSQLSGGQQQRVSIARALAGNPSVILADEPTGALDSRSAKLLLDRFEALNREGRATILMVTHDAFTASYCRRILFLQDGAVLTQLERGGQSRRAFFQQIIGVVTRLGGDQSDVL